MWMIVVMFIVLLYAIYKLVKGGRNEM
jgi:hypothetical protein